ncbi:MAG: dihydroorotate dehydrogenase [Immundisolibacterales bacterium]|nr:dihydroorotate dehydrogenase [Immundisolibacterales bacterium]
MSSAAAVVSQPAEEAAPPLAVELCGIPLASPVVLLSGCVGFGEEYTRVDGFDNRDAGAICLKGTTLDPRLGNPAHRVCETPCGMLNSIGLQNPGSREVIDRILPALDFGETRFFANIAGASVGEYEELARRFDDSPVDAIEINISCPNVEEGGLIFGNDPVLSARVVEACRRATAKPLFTKLSPNQTDVAENARLCIEAGTDGLAVVNTFVGMAIDVETGRPVIGAIRAGLSGPAIKPLALHLVYEVHRVAAPHGVPIIGQGGIAGVDDAIEFLLAGASAVGIGTALFHDPLIGRRVNEGLAQWLARRGVGGVAQTAGSMRAAAADGGGAR